MLKIPMEVPFWDEKEISCIFNPFLHTKPADEYIKILQSGIRSIFGIKYCVIANSGRGTIELALRVMGLKKKDGVILPSFVSESVLGIILKLGLQPQFVDIDRDYNIDPESVLRRIDSKTRVIIVPHLFGKLAKIKPITEIAHEKNIYVIDDAAQAVGAKYKGKFAGTMGDVGIFSFGRKILTATQGGALLTNNKEIYNNIIDIQLPAASEFAAHNRALKMLIKYRYRKYTFHLVHGYLHLKQIDKQAFKILVIKVRKISGLDASLAINQLKKLKKIIRKKKEYAKLFLSLLDGLNIKLPISHKNENIFNKFVIEIPQNINKTSFVQYLFNHGIETQETYSPLHLQKRFILYGKDYQKEKVSVLSKNGKLPRTESICKNLITLPIDPSLTETEIVYIASCVKNFFRKWKKV